MFLVKWLHYEYWPFWLFFLPMVPYWLYLSIRAMSFTYFTAANPGIAHGGVFGESKADILKKIDQKYLPKTLLFRKGTDIGVVLEKLKHSGLHFPVVVKPNVGERGTAVEKVDDDTALVSYLTENQVDFIVQEYVDYELELGVLYYRFPDRSETGITSIVVKEFLGVTGDGIATIRELINRNDRARLQLDKLQARFGKMLDIVPSNGEWVNLEPIGNHCRGTKFLSGMHLLNKQLVQIFDKISAGIDGFYFGRFDLKVKTVEDLHKGEHIQILELNGVTSEPAHIYDPSFHLLKAYREAARNMKVMFKVSQANRKLGVKCTPFFEMFSLIRMHFGGRKPGIQEAKQAVNTEVV